MDLAFQEIFLNLWKKYFNNSALPITFYYTDKLVNAEAVKPGSVPSCVIGALVKVQKGESLAFDVNSGCCPGGMRYMGFTEDIGPGFEYFLSYGIPGKMEGERFKKTPEMVKAYMEKYNMKIKAPGKYIVFKRWDMLEAADKPEVVIFFATADVLSGLYMLASFDEVDPNMQIAPWGSGCSSIVYYPYMETKSAHPRTVIGMFDISGRLFTPKDVLTFSAPMSKFTRMVNNMEESFLILKEWGKVQKRIK